MLSSNDEYTGYINGHNCVYTYCASPNVSNGSFRLNTIAMHTGCVWATFRVCPIND